MHDFQVCTIFSKKKVCHNSKYYSNLVDLCTRDHLLRLDVVHFDATVALIISRPHRTDFKRMHHFFGVLDACENFSLITHRKVFFFSFFFLTTIVTLLNLSNICTSILVGARYVQMVHKAKK